MKTDTQLIAAAAFLGAAILLRPRPALGRVATLPEDLAALETLDDYRQHYAAMALNPVLTGKQRKAYHDAAELIRAVQTNPVAEDYLPFGDYDGFTDAVRPLATRHARQLLARAVDAAEDAANDL